MMATLETQVLRERLAPRDSLDLLVYLELPEHRVGPGRPGLLDLSGLLAQQVPVGLLVNPVLKVRRATVEIWDQLVRLVNPEGKGLLEQLVVLALQGRLGQLECKATQDPPDSQG